MMEFKKVVHQDPVPHGSEAVLVGDIGGTNANFGFFIIRNTTTRLLFSLHIKSQTITDFSETVKSVLDYAYTEYALTVKNSCFAVAGVVSENRDYCKPTNLSFALSSQDIKEKTGLRCVYLVNDFEIIGYGLDKINQKDVVQVSSGLQRSKANKVILGAGTGLGKCILRWSETLSRYLPLASEGGHADFAAHNKLEFELLNFIQETEQRSCAVSWEDVLSGNGIKRLYAFFKHKNAGKKSNKELQKDGLHPDQIFNKRNKDEHAFNTFTLYTKFYARCAKNFALDGLALSGVYIAGGIAAKNLPLFKQNIFMKEFIDCGKQQELLLAIPVFVLTDYNVSLYGVAEFLLVEKMCET